jgi:hypothetical protein
MGRWGRAAWPVAAIAVVVFGTAGVVYAVWRSSQRYDLANFGSCAAAVAVAAAAVISRVWAASRRRSAVVSDALELDHLADALAGSVKDQWTRAAADRGLLQSEPIPVRWRKSSLAVTGSASVAAGSGRFQPIPGLSAVTQQRLRRGRISDLHAIYGGLGSGRLMIIGTPGCGQERRCGLAGACRAPAS